MILNWLQSKKIPGEYADAEEIGVQLRILA
jgi:hypothetical protein